MHEQGINISNILLFAGDVVVFESTTVKEKKQDCIFRGKLL
jgi:translation initiation factor IF-1